MKKYLFVTLTIASFFACNGQETSNKKVQDSSLKNNEMAYEAYGDSFEKGKPLSAEAMFAEYKNMEVGDTLKVSFETSVNTVCKMKGCWMTLEVPGDEDVRVSFKDYGFFVPKNIEDRRAIVSGKAFLTEISVEDLKHYAEDEGKSVEEILRITEPKKSMAFIADGVLLKK